LYDEDDEEEDGLVVALLEVLAGEYELPELGRVDELLDEGVLVRNPVEDEGVVVLLAVLELLSTVIMSGEVLAELVGLVPRADVRTAEVLLAEVLLVALELNERELALELVPDDVLDTDELLDPLPTADEVLVPLRRPLFERACPEEDLRPPTPPKSLRMPYLTSRPYQ